MNRDFTTTLSSVQSPQSSASTRSTSEYSTAALMALLVATGSLTLTAQSAMAQVTATGATINYNAASGAVGIDNNAFDIQTGAFENSSNIPLPSILPTQTQEGVAQPVRLDVLAPNTIEITPDIEYINQSLDDVLGTENGNRYILDTDSLQMNTQFDLRQREGAHAYGEGIEVTVFNSEGQIQSQESAFIRGYSVQVGPDGQPMPTAAQLEANYGAGDTVELRVLNVRNNGEAASESAIYFSQNGEIVVEDLQNGGDLDFNDGEYFEVSNGQGRADVVQERREVKYDTNTTETPLEPEMRQEEIVEQELMENNNIEFDTLTEEVTEYGQVSLPETVSTRIGHAGGITAASGEQLVYNRYLGNAQVRAGSDGIGVTGQLAPLVKNPNVPPTLLTGSLSFNPFVGNNEAGLIGGVGITQFLTPTHRQVTDTLGNAVINPDAEGPMLVEPTGLFHNRRWIGYVPPTDSSEILGDPISSTGGIFDLPTGQPITISPPNAQRVGSGNAAYTDNVGGFLIERTNGEISFIPQWTKDGYAEASISLAAGEATRVIYALVPQQAGQNLQLGETYRTTATSTGYRIADGNFQIISADQQPQNFAQEMAEVYAIEDTLANRANASTDRFNGIQGTYAEQFGGVRVPTVDVSIETEADARVGNLIQPIEIIAGDAGQMGYSQTTFAGGLYLGGSLTSGIGNQENRITQIDSTVETATDELMTRRILNTYLTPLVKVDTVVNETTEVSRQAGTALFDINRRGELTNAQFLANEPLVIDISSLEVERSSFVRRGEEALASSVTDEDLIALDSESILRDQQTTNRTESEPNFSALEGELTLGGILNFGNTPWTAAANTLRAELFARDAVVGRSREDGEIGWRAEVVFHPFGEVRTEAFQYDNAGNVVPVYQTENIINAEGKQIMETLTRPDGTVVEVPISRFALDSTGGRIAQTVGTGVAKGPGVYLRLEDALGDDEGMVVAGGMQLSF